MDGETVAAATGNFKGFAKPFGAFHLSLHSSHVALETLDHVVSKLHLLPVGIGLLTGHVVEQNNSVFLANWHCNHSMELVVGWDVDFSAATSCNFDQV